MFDPSLLFNLRATWNQGLIGWGDAHPDVFSAPKDRDCNLKGEIIRNRNAYRASGIYDIVLQTNKHQPLEPSKAVPVQTVTVTVE